MKTVHVLVVVQWDIKEVVAMTEGKEARQGRNLGQRPPHFGQRVCITICKQRLAGLFHWLS